VISQLCGLVFGFLDNAPSSRVVVRTYDCVNRQQVFSAWKNRFGEGLRGRPQPRHSRRLPRPHAAIGRPANIDSDRTLQSLLTIIVVLLSVVVARAHSIKKPICTQTSRACTIISYNIDIRLFFLNIIIIIYCPQGFLANLPHPFHQP